MMLLAVEDVTFMVGRGYARDAFLGINGGGHFLVKETFASVCLKRSFYGGGYFKATPSKNHIFLEAVVLWCPPSQNYFRRRMLRTCAAGRPPPALPCLFAAAQRSLPRCCRTLAARCSHMRAGREATPCSDRRRAISPIFSLLRPTRNGHCYS